MLFQIRVRRRWPLFRPPLGMIRVFKNIIIVIIGCFATMLEPSSGAFFCRSNHNSRRVFCVMDQILGYNPGDLLKATGHWGASDQAIQSLANSPADFTASKMPIHCHSHNDYWRTKPLYSAIGVGCSSVEADVWLVNNEIVRWSSKVGFDI